MKTFYLSLTVTLLLSLNPIWVNAQLNIKTLNQYVQVNLMWKAMRKYNDNVLEKTKKFHQKYSVELCKKNENKGNSTINGFHSSYVNLFNEIQKIRRSTIHLGLIQSDVIFNREIEIGKLISGFLQNQKYILSTDSLPAFGFYSSFLERYSKRIDAYSQERIKALNGFSSFKGSLPNDQNLEAYLEGIEIPESNLPSMDGKQHIDISKLLMEQIGKEKESLTNQTLPELEMPEIKMELDTNYKSIQPIDSISSFPKSNKKKDQDNSLEHKRLIDRFEVTSFLKNREIERLRSVNALVQIGFNVNKRTDLVLNLSTNSPYYFQYNLREEFFTIQKRNSYSLLEMNSVGMVYKMSERLGFTAESKLSNEALKVNLLKGFMAGVRICSGAGDKRLVMNVMYTPFGNEKIEIRTGFKF